MKKIIVVFLFLMFFKAGFSQLDGSWQGVLIQENKDGSSSDFSIWVSIKTDGNKINGKLRSEQVPPPYYKVSEIQGKMEGNKISFEETSIIKENTQKGFFWCLIVADLQYNEKENKLKGTYYSSNELCLPGTLVLVKSNKTFNSNETEIVESTTLDEVKKLLTNQKSVIGKQFVLTAVTFQSAKYTISPISYSYLNQLVDLLIKNPAIAIHLKGHTDSDGEDAANFLLSQRRAKSVANYLIKNGISTGRITYEGHGESRALAKNDTPENKQINRRVELLILTQ
ncbi:MAG: hypothetical protein COX70_03945 [Flavobacteriales bacterium CG_4_10_14_0_2_um_filter_32_8]|nr:MAG: hypothetical protein COX70_03945 [Flavobacteriales bacterium CG_4_10_14_0_2_um_filter_32_8]